MKILSGLAVLNDTIGKRIAYTYSEIDPNGMITNSNIKESFIVLDKETLEIISQLEGKVLTKIGANTVI